jgi:hypothetical protein
MPFNFRMQYEFEAIKIASRHPAKYGIHYKTPSRIGGGGYSTLQAATNSILEMIRNDLIQAQEEGIKLPDIAMVRNGAKSCYQLPPSEFEDLKQLLTSQRHEGFPEFTFGGSWDALPYYLCV